MNHLEAVWLGRRLAAITDCELFPLLNIGSSTLDFRTRVQPYIEQHIFGPLRTRGGRVSHLDIKAAEGVDIVGNLLDRTFLERVARMQFRSVLVSNLFEHVTARQEICDVLLKLLPPDGYVFVSGPHSYPYHADPIDTMFRPTIEEMHAHFPGTRIIDSAIISSGNWRQWNAAERGRPLDVTIARLFFPFYRPKTWWELARQAPYIFRPISAFAIVLQKDCLSSTEGK